MRRKSITSEEYDAALQEVLKNTEALEKNIQPFYKNWDYPEHGQTAYTMNFYELPRYRKLVKRYSLQETAGNGTTFERARRVMHWLCTNTYYCGQMNYWLPDRTAKLLNFSVGKDFSHAITCRQRALVFADCLCALNIFAYPVAGISADGSGIHLMAHVYLPELQKWVLLDPSFDASFTTAEGALLNLFEVRGALARQETVLLDGFHFNGISEKHRDVYESQFLPCMYYLASWADNRVQFGGFYNRRHISLPEIQPCGESNRREAYWGGKVQRQVGKEDFLRAPAGWLK